METYSEKMLETEVGKKAVEREKENIISRIYSFVEARLFSKLKTRLLDTLKKWLFEPICETLECIFVDKSYKMGDNNKLWIKKNINFAGCQTIKYYDIGSDIDDNI